ncbi:MAG: DUF2391 family protein [Xenococcaceae cyanobacterium]
MTKQYPDRPKASRKGDRSQKFNPWKEELTELISGASGGFLFGIPLLYTMEVWFIGSYVQSHLLLFILAITYIIVFMLNRAEGFRQNGRDGVLEAATESVESISIGIVCATLMLILLQRITAATSLSEALSKIIFEAVPFSLGVALSKSILCKDSQSHRHSNSSQTRPKTKRSNRHAIWSDTLADFSGTAIGVTIMPLM